MIIFIYGTGSAFKALPVFARPKGTGGNERKQAAPKRCLREKGKYEETFCRKQTGSDGIPLNRNPSYRNSINYDP